MNEPTELQKAVELVRTKVGLFSDMTIFEFEEIVKQLEALQTENEETEKEIGEFQNQVKELIDKIAGSNVDGGGCDSGDWRDFTLAEIGQGLSHVIDERDTLKLALESMTKERDGYGAVLDKIAEIEGVVAIHGMPKKDAMALVVFTSQASNKATVDDLNQQLESTRAENARMREALKYIRQISTGEAQIADTDTEAMLPISRLAQDALSTTPPTTTDNSKENVK